VQPKQQYQHRRSRNNMTGHCFLSCACWRDDRFIGNEWITAPPTAVALLRLRAGKRTQRRMPPCMPTGAAPPVPVGLVVRHPVGLLGLGRVCPCVPQLAPFPWHLLPKPPPSILQPCDVFPQGVGIRPAEMHFLVPGLHRTGVAPLSAAGIAEWLGKADA